MFRFGFQDATASSTILARSEATKQSTLVAWRDGLLRFARNDGKHELSISRRDTPE
jgi:hypothetical protein